MGLKNQKRQIRNDNWIKCVLKCLQCGKMKILMLNNCRLIDSWQGEDDPNILP